MAAQMASKRGGRALPPWAAPVAVWLSLCLASLAARSALAFPRPGQKCPSVLISDAWGRQIDIARLGGQPVLVVYEDTGSSDQNRALKEELSRLAAGDAYRGRVALVAVADVAAYDYWPLRGLVKDAIRGASRKLNLSIFCDWDGHFRTALGLSRGISNVVLYGRDGALLIARSGTMPAEERNTLIELLRRELTR